MTFDVDKLLEFLSRYNYKKFHLALANNHILDNETDGFDYLVERLEENNVQYFGTKERPNIVIGDVLVLNVLTAETVAKRNISEQRLNYLFYNTNKINKQIAEAESQNEKLIFYPHWGRDMDTKIFKTYEKKLKFNKKWLLFGHHPHVISGIRKDYVFSLGNTYIPHPYYYDKYPATRFGLAVLLDVNTMNYELYSTTLSRKTKKYYLGISSFEKLDKSIIHHGSDFSFLKKLFLYIFEFNGNAIDYLKLSTLQIITSLFKFKYKMTNIK